MKFNLSLLKEFLPQLTLSAEELAEKLSVIGHESEVIDQSAVEAKIFPNRGDCLSYYGLARELAAHYPEFGRLVEPTLADLPATSELISLSISRSADSLVTADHLLKISNYQAQESPLEVVNQLRIHGLQPKDLIIDLTNIVMFELGQPLHAFDYDLVSAGLEIDTARSGESLSLIGESRPTQLAEGVLIQRTDGQPIDLAGIKGGATSAINHSTETILLQAAAFQPTAIRLSSRQTGVATDASYRYQRGVDPLGAPKALRRLLYLLKQYAPKVTVDGYQSHQQSVPAVKIEVSPERLSRLLGVEVSTANIHQLERQGFQVSQNMVTVPSWRFDVRLAADLAEEIARIIGMNAIPPRSLSPQKPVHSQEYNQLLSLKLALSSLGGHETLTYSFVSPTRGEIKLQNPRTEEQSELRQTMLDGLLQTLAKNPYLKRVIFYEIGHVFEPAETNKLGLIVAGYKEPAIRQLEAELVKTLQIDSISFEAVTPTQLERYDVKQPKVWFAELETTAAKPKASRLNDLQLTAYRPISKYPPVVRDVTLVVDSSTDLRSLERRFYQLQPLLIAELVDTFINAEAIGAGKVAATYRLMLQDLNRSLTDEEVEQLLTGYFHELQKEVEFTIR